MSAIAQRRVAGATALMILLYLLQVALFAASAGAAVTQVGETAPGTCPQGTDGWSSHQFDTNQVVSGAFGEIEFSTDGTESSELLTATINGGYAVEVCVKQGSNYTIFQATFADAGGGLPATQTVWAGDLSHWGWRLVAEPEGPEFLIGACDETTGLTSVSFTVEAGTEVTIDGVPASAEEPAFQPGNHEIDLSEGTYTWRLWSPINSGTQVDNGTFDVGKCDVVPETFGGDLTVEKVVVISSGAPTTTDFDFTVTDEAPFSLADSESKSFSYALESAAASETVTITEDAIAETGWTTSISCTDESTGGSSVEVTVGHEDDITCTVTNTFRDDAPPPPPPPSTTTTVQSTSVNFDAFCDDAGNFVGAFSLPNASGSLDINGDGFFGAGETNLASGTYVLTGETYAWQATADAGFTLTGITSGSGETETCAEVLGTTITTTPSEVSADTLPFTGFESGDAMKMGLLALLAGVLMLFAVRGPKDDEPATVDMGGWSSL